MGGSVSIRALLATDNVRASSFWSTMDVADLTHRIEALDGPVNLHHAAGDESTPIANSEILAEALAEAGLLAVFLRYPESDHFFGGERREYSADMDAALFRGTMQ
jgi:dienelactone hydrolase